MTRQKTLAMSLVIAVVVAAASVLPALASGADGKVLTGGGGALNGSLRIGSDYARLACLGVNAPDVFAEVGTSEHTSASNQLQLVVKPSGEAQVIFHATFGYAVYPAPGDDLPNWGDPGFLYRGQVASAFTTTLENLTPNEFSQVEIPVSIPVTLRSEGGGSRVDIVWDVLIVIGLEDGEPIYINGATVGGRCP